MRDATEGWQLQQEQHVEMLQDGGKLVPLPPISNFFFYYYYFCILGCSKQDHTTRLG